MKKVLFCIAFFVAYTIQGITGFAGNIFAMPIGTALLGLNSSVAILNAMGCFACGLLAFMNLKSVDWRELCIIIAGMIPFMLLGIWLDTLIEVPMLLRIFGITIVIVGVYNLVKHEERTLPKPVLWLALALAGLIQGMFVSGGAFLVIYAIQRVPDKQRFRATLSMVWAILNLLYMVISYHAGYYTSDVLWVVLACIPISVAATVLGNRLQKALSQERFLKVTYVLLVVIGAVLLIR